MRVRGIRRVTCRCGKEIYYSKEAAESSLARFQVKGMINPERKECRVYQCTKRPDVWHLTSLTLEGLEKRRRAAMLGAIRQWGAVRNKTIIVPKKLWHLRVNHNPYRKKITIRKDRN